MNKTKCSGAQAINATENEEGELRGRGALRTDGPFVSARPRAGASNFTAIAPGAAAMYRGSGQSKQLANMKRNTIRLAIITCALALAGCISSHETVVRDVERTRVEFESETAGRIFYEALSRMKDGGSHSESTTKLEIPIIFEHERHVVRGHNAKFNDAVTRCDTNKDGRITEVEARIFAEQVEK